MSPPIPYRPHFLEVQWCLINMCCWVRTVLLLMLFTWHVSSLSAFSLFSLSSGHGKTCATVPGSARIAPGHCFLHIYGATVVASFCREWWRRRRTIRMSDFRWYIIGQNEDLCWYLHQPLKVQYFVSLDLSFKQCFKKSSVDVLSFSSLLRHTVYTYTHTNIQKHYINIKKTYPFMSYTNVHLSL